MESTVDIKKRIHEFIDIADERTLRVINGINDMKEQEDNYPEITDWNYNKRREKYLTGKGKSYT
jgi:pyruvate formate-lyase activating enzyme-like uncharacterized protein